MIAHIKTLDGQNFETQSLPEHLSGTAEMAAQFAASFNNAEWGRLLGLWHDLGKYSDEFQEYIKVIQVMRKMIRKDQKLIIRQQVRF